MLCDSSSRCRWLVCNLSFCCQVAVSVLTVLLVGMQCHFVFVCRGSSSRCCWLVCSVILLSCAGALPPGAVGWYAVSFCCRVPGLFLPVTLFGMQCHFVVVCRGSSSRCCWLVCSVILLSCAGALPPGAVGWYAVSFCCRVPGLFLPVPLVGLQCHFVHGHVAVSVLCLFFAVPLVGLQLVILLLSGC